MAAAVQPGGARQPGFQSQQPGQRTRFKERDPRDRAGAAAPLCSSSPARRSETARLRGTARAAYYRFKGRDLRDRAGAAAPLGSSSPARRRETARLSEPTRGPPERPLLAAPRLAPFQLAPTEGRPGAGAPAAWRHEQQRRFGRKRVRKTRDGQGKQPAARAKLPACTHAPGIPRLHVLR